MTVKVVKHLFVSDLKIISSAGGVAVFKATESSSGKKEVLLFRDKKNLNEFIISSCSISLLVWIEDP